ncbi:MAG TPA: hypothetical protein VL024_07200 [Castellaniella sp.]|nr:hypothetical protein [Castellaniella sp.]
MFETGLEVLCTHSSCVDFALKGSDLRLRVEAHAPGVFRLRCATARALDPDKTTPKALRHADLLLSRHEAVGELACDALDDGAGWRLTQGDVVLRLDLAAQVIQLWRNDQMVLETLPGGLVMQLGGDLPHWQLGIQLAENEGVFGLGETLGDLDRRGTRLVSDHPGARVLPLAWSPRGWGLYINTLDRVVHDVAVDADLYQLDVAGPQFDGFLFAGDPSEILNQYTALTGRAGQPGLWPLGLWLDQAPGQSAAGSTHQIRALREHGLALDVLSLATPAAIGFQADKPVFEWADRLPEWREFSAACAALDI